MFKSSRWRSEKNKIKVVFKLQFHATKVVGNALSVSLTPADTGKPTMRLEKAAVREGSCYWENPIFETVKLSHDSKTGKISEKIYHFQVSDGFLKTGSIGEVSFDFAAYVGAVIPCSVSLPLKYSKSGAVLHVLIQRMPENVDQREVEEFENVIVRPVENDLKANGDVNGSIYTNSIEDAPVNKGTPSDTDLNGNHGAFSGSDIISSSESSSSFDTPRELAPKNNEINRDPSIFIPSPCPTDNHLAKVYQKHQRSQSEWSVGSYHGLSTDDSTQDSQYILPRDSSLQASDIEIKKLKTDLLVLSRQAELSDLELQTIRKQIVKENKKGQDLYREIVNLKVERDGFKVECERLVAFQKRQDEARVKNKLKFEKGDSLALFEELRQELDYEKDLNLNLRIQLQKTQESNSELILAVRDLDEMLERINNNEPELCKKSATSETPQELLELNSKCQTDDDEEQQALEELVKEHKVGNEACLLEQRVLDLCSEIQIYRRDKDELEMQMEQLALDYEILKQENHDISYKLEQSQLQDQLKMQYECSGSFAMMNDLETQVESLESELKKQSKELSDSFATINKLETHILSLEEEMEKQTQGFEADLEVVTHAKVEQERRAIRAEDVLRTTRLKNANTAERLQEEFKRLSMQMASTFDANEKLAVKALADANELRTQKIYLEEMLKKSDEELQLVKEGYEVKLHELSAQLDIKTRQIEQTMFEISDKCTQLEIQKKHAEKMYGEIERFTKENNALLEQERERKTLTAEVEKMKSSANEMELRLQRAYLEKNEMEETIGLVRKEADKTMQELDNMRCLKDEKDTIIENLQLQLNTLTAQYNELNNYLLEIEAEKEKLQKQVLQLKSDLRKEDAVTSIEKKLKDSNGRAPLSNGMKASLQNKKSPPEPRGSKEVANMRERIKTLEGLIMLKEAALEASTNSFLDKENYLKNKIKEVESRLEELNQRTANLCEYSTQAVAKDTEGSTMNGNMREELNDTDIKLNTQNGVEMSTTKSNQISYKVDTQCEGNLDETLMEMTLLKQINISMEGELKEMQKRYSEISLKFAEVEGERQQLVMAVRNLKNAKKS